MLSLKNRYLVRKAMWGLLFLITGIVKILLTKNINSSLGNILDIICWCIFGGIILIEVCLKKKKVEPEDEMAILHMLQAKASIYDTFFLVMFIYIIIGVHYPFVMNVGITFIILGILKIAEYILFEFYEKRIE